MSDVVEKIKKYLDEIKEEIGEVKYGNVEFVLSDGKLQQVNVRTTYRPDNKKH